MLLLPKLAVPMVALPEPMPQRVCNGPFPAMLQLSIALLLAPFGPPVTDCNHMTALVVLVLVFVIVRFRVAVDKGHMVLMVEPLLPSIVTQSAPFKTIRPVADKPEINGFAPAAGFILSVFTELAAAFELIVIGKVSVGYVASVRLNKIGPPIH